KGLTLFGSSRSGSADFQRTVDLYKEHEEIVNYLSTLVGQTHTVRNIEDITNSFEGDLSSSWGKTVMRWKIYIVIKESLTKCYIIFYKVIFSMFHVAIKLVKQHDHMKAVFVVSRENKLQGNLRYVHLELMEQLPGVKIHFVHAENKMNLKLFKELISFSNARYL